MTLTTLELEEDQQAEVSRYGYVDPQNERTLTHVTDLFIDNGLICADCGTCGLSSSWVVADAQLAAFAVRNHGADCEGRR